MDRDGDARVLPSKTTTTVQPGEKILVQPAGGGGFGDPTERDAETVLSDVLDGYVSEETARETYDVGVDPEAETYEVGPTRTRGDD